MPESPLSPSAARQTPVSSLLSHTDVGAGEKAANGDSCSGVRAQNCQSLLHKQVFLAMMAPQQMQQFLSPNQLQALIHKQQALLLQQLPAQQLVFQQLLQEQIPSDSSSNLSSGYLSPTEMQQLWKELRCSLSDNGTIMKGNQRISTQVTLTSGQLSESPYRADCNSVNGDWAPAHVLFGHGVCNWPGCESVCENVSQFIKHMSREHTLDDKSTAHCRVQMQVVQQLELQLSKERERLHAMMAHLHLPSLRSQSPKSDAAADLHGPQLRLASLSNKVPALRHQNSGQCTPKPLSSASSPPQGCGEEEPIFSYTMGTMKHRHHPLEISLSSENEYEIYKNADIRPPFTYAALIRQAIIEASDMQLTLNEIYNWFTRTFAYFRRNAATWKNAVRHNLSLHKCFVRVENVKGAVWTVDEEEYHRRRSQKIAGNPSLVKNVCSSLTVGTTHHSTFMAALAEASLPGLKKESVSRNLRGENKSADGKSSRKQSLSSQVQQQLYFEDGELKVNDQQGQLPTLKPVSLQQHIHGNSEELLFDLE
ncbi:forkhead box protein P2-like isoform X2 [Girardinichthys multiradiatus]|uniref:forkhead box protein P2-like isoform X2 n=1 Tax=Girardinichthys multiradiatus TaxID=208333 RepID=UPI001FADC146|nr:forkhead box protein P2-like isoform X2 [Girardinichthys multiradiatus]